MDNLNLATSTEVKGFEFVAGQDSLMQAQNLLNSESSCVFESLTFGNQIHLKDGSVLVFTPQWQFVAKCRDVAFVDGYLLLASSVIEKDDEYRIYKADEMAVVSTEGTVIHEGIRGFMPLNEKFHLIRLVKDGGWMFCGCDGVAKRKKCLKKCNLTVGGHAVMFDERGKLRRGMQGLYYQDAMVF